MVNGLLNFAETVAPIPRRKMIGNSPQHEYEQRQRGCHANDDPHHGVISLPRAVHEQQSSFRIMESMNRRAYHAQEEAQNPNR
jgi:hypothetical protein